MVAQDATEGAVTLVGNLVGLGRAMGAVEVRGFVFAAEIAVKFVTAEVTILRILMVAQPMASAALDE